MATKTSAPVRVAALRVRNILGIVDAEIRPGAVTLIEGRNGQGKTSLLEAFRAVLSGGNDATLLRKGADEGEIVMVLNDGVEIQKTVTADGTDLKVRHPDFGRVSKPRTFIDRLLDAFSLNPVDFLTAKADKRLDLLLEAIPLKVHPADISEAMELSTVDVDTDAHALRVLALLEKNLFEQRTGINRSARDKRTAAEEMRRALPPAAVEDSAAELQRSEGEYEGFRKFVAERRENIAAEYQAEYGAAERDLAAAVVALTQEREDTISKIREEFGARIEETKVYWDRIIRTAREKQDAAGLELQNEIGATEQELKNRIATARAAMDAYTRTETTRQHIADLELGASVSEGKAQELTAAIVGLDVVKSELLDRLPIKGVEIRDGEIYVDGVPFSRVNTARQVRLAFDVARLRAGSLPVMLVDGIERLDSESLAALEEVARESEVQLVLAKVTDGPLEVKTA